jgi:hypothetical protein
MTIKEIFSKETDREVIAELKSRRHIPQPDVASAKKAIDPKLHGINDRILRPDKRVRVDGDSEADSAQKVIDVGGQDSANYKTEKVARISLALQKLIIKRAVAFLFGNPVAYNVSPDGEKQEMIIKALKRILYDVKSNSLNRRIARAVFGFKECAELWYPVEKPNDSYGFKSGFKLRCALFSPAFGDALFPYFDETGDMTAFSREFSRTETGGSVETVAGYFETWTDSEHWLWKHGTNGFETVEGYPKGNAIGKIPVVYAYQDEFETQDVDSLIDRLETLLSNFADTNDYHAAPKLFVTGQINGWAKKGESGAVIEGEEGATMNYVSWASAPESVKLEIETLLKMIYTITQTPDISFDALKGLGAISGIALKLLFMDAHLKVQDKKEIFDEFLQRRVNVIKAFIGKFNTALESECEDLEIEPEITPYMLTSELDELTYWMTANGNKPVISQEESIEKTGLSMNPKDTFEKIREETGRENTFTIGEPVDA